MFDFLINDRQIALREEVVDFVKWVPRDLIIGMDSERINYPKEFLQEAGRRGLLGLRFPKEYGGRGLTWLDEVVAIEEVGVLGSALSCLYCLPSIVGEAIYRFGSEFQKEKYLKPTLEGKLYCAEALTEPRGGSDFFGTKTIAKREGDYYVISGQKRFIVGAEGADYFLVYARTDESVSPHKGISVFIVDRGPSVKVEHLYGLMGTRGGGTGRVFFDNVKVPRENLVGEENRGAEIFYQMMIPERLTTAAGAIGMAKVALEIATYYSTRRKAFDRPIREFQAVSFKVADSITMLDAARSLVYVTARAVDSEDVPGSLKRRMVSEAKKFATETAWTVINNAMQILGGIGYTRVYPIERLLRDSRIMMIWTGTNEIMNLIIQREYYREIIEGKSKGRNVEYDAPDATCGDEKVYE